MFNCYKEAVHNLKLDIKQLINEAEHLIYTIRTPNSIIVILFIQNVHLIYTIRTPNSIIVILFIQNVSVIHSKPSMLKFIFDSARLGLFSSANILQIADVAL